MYWWFAKWSTGPNILFFKSFMSKNLLFSYPKRLPKLLLKLPIGYEWPLKNIPLSSKRKKLRLRLVWESLHSTLPAKPQKSSSHLLTKHSMIPRTPAEIACVWGRVLWPHRKNVRLLFFYEKGFPPMGFSTKALWLREILPRKIEIMDFT